MYFDESMLFGGCLELDCICECQCCLYFEKRLFPWTWIGENPKKDSIKHCWAYTYKTSLSFSQFLQFIYTLPYPLGLPWSEVGNTYTPFMHRLHTKMYIGSWRDFSKTVTTLSQMFTNQIRTQRNKNMLIDCVEYMSKCGKITIINFYLFLNI